MVKTSDVTWLQLRKLALLFLLLPLANCSFPRGERARAMEAELKGKIEKAFVNGGDRTEVEAFINQVKVEGIKPTLQPFTSDLSGLGDRRKFPLKPKNDLAIIKGYEVANFGSVDSDARFMHNVHLHAAFFFDGEDHLIEYQTYLTYHD